MSGRNRPTNTLFVQGPNYAIECEQGIRLGQILAQKKMVILGPS